MKLLKTNIMKKGIYSLLTIVLLFLGIDNFADLDLEDQTLGQEQNGSPTVVAGEAYRSAQDVADYLYYYEELPPNYITKKEARDLGWVASEGNLWDVAPNASIGGDSFGNFEGLLPEKEGRRYREADINYQGYYRSSERLVYSNDDLYFYTEDHYQSFDEIVPRGQSE